jgi:hypothetical protein
MVLTVPVKGYFEEYCYFYVSDSTRHGFIIDPGAQADQLLDIIVVIPLDVMQVFKLKPYQVISLFELLHQYGSQLT